MAEGDGFEPQMHDGGMSEKDRLDLERMMNPDAAKDEVPFEPVGHVFRAKRDAEDAAALDKDDFTIEDMFPAAADDEPTDNADDR